ncbi:MAG: twin-arginine translocase subunit TatC [Bacteroides sp.]|nr:twin-arginine translocase subunit TatC [Bacteroides sp.]MCM1085802.1 twin-arginine translocase subunit TatC [Bacteroides sp.]
MDSGGKTQSFWEHLDDLRHSLIRVVIAAAVLAVAAFCFKETLFSVVLAPQKSGFITYRLLARLSAWMGSPMGDFSVPLINTGLARQFVIHMKTALWAGVILASPYILYQIFRFVSPALYTNEKHYAVRVAGSGYVLFLVGVAVGYFLIFPLTFRFLGTYTVSGDIANLISLDSYISTLMSMCLTMGIVFEIPVLCWLFGKLGFLSVSFMKRYRKHAIVIIVFAAAIITPTSDVFTLAVVSLPMYLLYEAGIFLVRRTGRKRPAELPVQE